MTKPVCSDCCNCTCWPFSRKKKLAPHHSRALTREEVQFTVMERERKASEAHRRANLDTKKITVNPSPTGKQHSHHSISQSIEGLGVSESRSIPAVESTNAQALFKRFEKYDHQVQAVDTPL